MPKGNHVFNNFDGTVHGAFKAALAAFGKDRDLDSVNGSGGDVDKAKASLNTGFAKSYQYYNEIRDHASTALLHKTQDDEPVAPDDANSQAYGKIATEFSASVLKWAWGDEEVDPMDLWRQLVNVGYDATAANNYVKKGSSAEGTPKSEPARLERCQDLHKFVKGDLSRLVMRWLLGLRFDLMISKAVGYETKPDKWKEKLQTAMDKIK